MTYPATRVLMAVTIGCALCVSPAVADDRPITGDAVAGFEPVEAAVTEFMDRIDCSAATVAISKDGKLLYSRGFGWSDAEKTTPTPPDALLRIASVSKPITAAAIRNAIRAKQLTPETKVFPLLGIIPPGGNVADPRVNDITVAQLLEHKGGWDSKAAFDPMFRITRIEQELKLTDPATSKNVIEYMLTQPLQFAPGERSAYSNFGYLVLGRVLEQVHCKPYIDSIQQSVLTPLEITDIRVGFMPLQQRDPREVSYPVSETAYRIDVMDAHGGLIASAPALCRFLDSYWISGSPRRPRQTANYTFFGSLPGTTAMVRQRNDGYNIAVLLNARRNRSFDEDNRELRRLVDESLDQVRDARSREK